MILLSPVCGCGVFGRSSDECSDELNTTTTAAHRRSSSFSGALAPTTTSSSESTPPGGSNNCLGSAESIQLRHREKSQTLDGTKIKNSLKDYGKNGGGGGGNNGVGGNGKKNKVAKQISKSFGSLGRSVSKKLKKMGKLSLNHKDSSNGKLAKRSSVVSVTQSTKVNHTASLLDNERILSAQLHLIQIENYSAMVENYLLTARERFEADRALRRKQDVEMRQKAEERKSVSGKSAFWNDAWQYSYVLVPCCEVCCVCFSFALVSLKGKQLIENIK